MPTFTLDHRLVTDCYQLGRLDKADLLLMNNAHFPWLVLVPHTQQTEFFELTNDEQHALLISINALSGFIKQHFSSEKLNIASIGNVVKQLHIHIIGRHHKDLCWPGVVWGTAHSKPYVNTQVKAISDTLAQQLGASFIATATPL